VIGYAFPGGSNPRVAAADGHHVWVQRSDAVISEVAATGFVFNDYPVPAPAGGIAARDLGVGRSVWAYTGSGLPLHFLSPSFVQPTGMPYPLPTCVGVDSQGNGWFASASAGKLMRCDGANHSWSYFNLPGGFQPSSILVDSHDQIWMDDISSDQVLQVTTIGSLADPTSAVYKPYAPGAGSMPHEFYEANGYMYVVCSGTNQMAKLDPSAPMPSAGAKVSPLLYVTLPAGSNPQGAAVRNNYLFLNDAAGPQIIKVSLP
jgi:hypothetical protein